MIGKSIEANRGSRGNKSFIDMPVNRRGLFGLGAKVVGGGALALAGANAVNFSGRVETPDATFIPLYENHITGLQPSEIPGGLNFISAEHSQSGVTELTAREILYRKGASSFKKGVTTKLAQEGVKIILPDIDDGILATTAGLLVLTAEFTLGLGAFVKLRSSRREFFQYSALPLGAWTSSPILLSIPMVATEVIGRKSAVDRLATRVNGLTANTHPENSTVFFRNLVNAHKLLDLAKKEKKDGQEQRIGLNYGKGHSGMEDMLRAGSEVSGNLITSYPAFMLKHFMEVAGSVERFASTVVIDLPKDFKEEELQSPESEERLRKRIIIDTELAEAIKAKIS